MKVFVDARISTHMIRGQSSYRHTPKLSGCPHKRHTPPRPTHIPASSRYSCPGPSWLCASPRRSSRASSACPARAPATPAPSGAAPPSRPSSRACCCTTGTARTYRCTRCSATCRRRSSRIARSRPCRRSSRGCCFGRKANCIRGTCTFASLSSC